MVYQSALVTAGLALVSGVANGEQRRLKIVNGCSEQDMWIAHMQAANVGPDPQDVKLAPGKSYDFLTQEGSGGLSAARWWPKLGCNEHGTNCSVGGSGGPGEGCVIRSPGHDDYSHCAPPSDTKLEANFAASGSGSLDFLDMSLVDGYSLPFKLSVQGVCHRNLQAFSSMDCSALSLQGCPKDETLDGNTVSLQAVDPKTDKVANCYSPCMKLTDDKWGKPVGSPQSSKVAPYCCAGSYANPQTCQAGPIMQTKYLAYTHSACPDAYAYAFDDHRGTITCQSNSQYVLTFLCPATVSGTVMV